MKNEAEAKGQPVAIPDELVDQLLSGYRRPEDLLGNAPFGVLVTQSDDAAADDPRIVTLPLSSLLLLR
jgi:hypothetical protein